MLCSPSRNPVRKQSLDAQIAFHDILVQKRQLQRMLKRNIQGGRRYLCAFVKKTISRKNCQERQKYGESYIYDSLFDFFDYIVYTNEAHVDPTSQAQERILREQGTRDKPENIDERPPLKDVRFHIAAWISWWEKVPKLRFYNDDKDEVQHPPYSPKPCRRSTTENQEEYNRRIAE